MTQHRVDLNQKYHHDLACSNTKGEVLVYPVKRVLMQQKQSTKDVDYDQILEGGHHV